MTPRLIKHGLTPAKNRHQNLDWIKTFEPQVYAGVKTPTFPAEYLTDDGSWFPNQNAEGMPEGCTNYASAALARKLGTTDASPQTLETYTHANQRGGITLIESLDTARRKLRWFTYTYQVKAYNLDYFSAFQLAQGSGIPEKRSISVGVPWFRSWEDAMVRGVSVMPMPTDAELAAVRANPNAEPWHDSELDGWLVINGQTVYRDKSWQGTQVGAGGYIYFPREVINTVMSIRGTAAYTATNLGAARPQTIDLSLIAYWISYFRTWVFPY